MNSASLCSLAGRYENPIPPRCLAPIDFLKIPALVYLPFFLSAECLPYMHCISVCLPVTLNAFCLLLYLSLSVCLSACLPRYIPVSWLTSLSACFYIYLLLSTCLPLYLPVFLPSACLHFAILTVCLSACFLSVCFICLHVCLVIFLSP